MARRYAARPGLVLTAILLAGAAAGNVTAAEPQETKGTLDEVTVYRNQALVIRKVAVAGPAGLREIVVSDLPEQLVPESLYAESADGVAVRSVRYRVRPVEQDVREEVRKLDEQIQDAQDKLQAVEKRLQVTEDYKSYLGKLEQFTAPSADVELTRGVLNAETLKALSNFLHEEHTSIADDELKRAAEQRELNGKMQLLGRERQVLTGGSAKTLREAVVFVSVTEKGGQMRLGYLVGQASWSPSYNVRTSGKRNDALVEYNASIQQMSGEDWNDVSMTLSTADPSLAAKAPALEPLVITLSHNPETASGPRSNADYLSAKKALERKRHEVEIIRNTQGLQDANAPAKSEKPMDVPGEFGARGDIDATLNVLAGEAQVLDLVNVGKVSRATKPGQELAAEGVSVTYSLPGRSSLPSRSDRQLIQIASLEMAADFYKVATPVLTSYVYEQAEATNNSKTVLLPGPVSTYVSGQFVGRGEMPMVAVGEKFTIGFGIDSSLRATRELVVKTESIQGGNRLVDFEYRLAVENFGSEAAKVRLLDRLPTAKETDVKLTLVAPGKALSEDAAYQAQRKKGMLRWDVEVPAQAVGPKAFSFEYKTELEYDKQMSIAGLPSKK